MRLWDVASGQTIQSASAEGVMGLAFSPDGSLVAAACGFTVKIWDVENGQIVGSLRHSAELLSVAFSADGSLIAAGAYDGNIYLWGVSQ
jgi:WD40 repeat protein